MTRWECAACGESNDAGADRCHACRGPPQPTPVAVEISNPAADHSLHELATRPDPGTPNTTAVAVALSAAATSGLHSQPRTEGATVNPLAHIDELRPPARAPRRPDPDAYDHQKACCLLGVHFVLLICLLLLGGGLFEHFELEEEERIAVGHWRSRREILSYLRRANRAHHRSKCTGGPSGPLSRASSLQLRAVRSFLPSGHACPRRSVRFEIAAAVEICAPLSVSPPQTSASPPPWSSGRTRWWSAPRFLADSIGTWANRPSSIATGRHGSIIRAWPAVNPRREPRSSAPPRARDSAQDNVPTHTVPRVARVHQQAAAAASAVDRIHKTSHDAVAYCALRSELNVVESIFDMREMNLTAEVGLDPFLDFAGDAAASQLVAAKREMRGKPRIAVGPCGKTRALTHSPHRSARA